MRSPLRLFLLAVTTALCTLAVMAPASASGSAPHCGITWGSLEKSAGGTTPTAAQVGAVRAGQHGCYDRLVIDLSNAPGWASYDVAYGSVRGVASGQTIPVAGGAALRITLRAHGEGYVPADRNHLVNVSGFGTFRQVVSAGSFEGVTGFGLGVRARLPFRAFTLSGPAPGQARLVIDVAHRWR